MPTRRSSRSTCRPIATTMPRSGPRKASRCSAIRPPATATGGASPSGAAATHPRPPARDTPAAERYLRSLRPGALRGDNKDLPRTIVAERALDTSRSMWWLGDPGKAVDLAMEALAHDPESEELATTAVAFLIEAGRYRDA